MLLSKRYCIVYDDGTRECGFNDDSFWYTDKGIIIKWVILAVFFAVFFGWFVGGYIHAKKRLRAGKPLLGYHRFLVSYAERRRYGQAGPPQNHFTFYQTQNPYQQRQDGAWTEPPPQYMGNDAPPQYFAPPPPAGATKTHPSQGGMEMPQYGAPGPQGAQQSGVVGSSSTDVEQGQQSSSLPPRPPQATKAKITGLLDRFKK